MHGKNAKHHIKFDDGEETIYLNVKIAGDRFWSRVDVDDARIWIQQMKRADAKQLDQRLNRPPTSQDVRKQLMPGQSTIELPPLGGPVASGSAVVPATEISKRRLVTNWTGKAGSASSQFNRA